MKRCPDCRQDKPVSDFPQNASRPDGLGYYCKACYSRRYRRHRERKAAREGRTIGVPREVRAGCKYCPGCKEELPRAAFGSNRASHDGLTAYCGPCHNAKGRETVQRLYGSTRDYHLKRRYGITSADVDAMIEAQGGTCAVCAGKPEHVDHDHETDQVRGILCFNCNQALGNVRDDPTVLLGLVRYLRGRHLVAVECYEPPKDAPVFEVHWRHHSA